MSHHPTFTLAFTRLPCDQCVIHVNATTVTEVRMQFFFLLLLFVVRTQKDSRALTCQPSRFVPPPQSQDGPGSGHVRNLQRPSVRLQGRHLVPGGDPDRAGTDRAPEPRDESHASAAENSQVGTAHPHAPVPMVSCWLTTSGAVSLCRDKPCLYCPNVWKPVEPVNK